jgi:TolB-like protein/Tfp pilus assembly protein PilF
MSRFLRFTVEYAVNGRAGELKEYLLGTEVFDRNSSYDPRLDPVVRVEARRLRSKLALFYEGEGKTDELVIEFPKGSYVPRFQRRGEQAGPAAPAPEPQDSTIALLPFSNLSSAHDNEYFSDGLTQELIHLLTKVEGLRVVAWNSSAQLRGQYPDPYEVGQQLKVGNILLGSVRSAGDQIRITAQLVDTATGYYLWSETFDRRMQDLFAIQEEIALAIVRTLKANLVCKTSQHGEVRNVEAYNLYLKGRFHWNKRTSEGLYRSVGYFEQAIEADPNSATAYAGLADAYSLLSDYGIVRPMEALPKAEKAALKALQLDPLLGEAETSLAFIRSLYDWKWAEGEQRFRRAIALNPSYVTAHHWFGLDHLAVRGMMDEAMREIEIARDLDPLSPIIREGVGYMCMLRGDHDRALQHYRDTLELDPYFYRAYTSMGRAYIQKGMYDLAIEMLEKGRALSGDLPTIFAALGQAYALSGRPEKAREYLAQLTRMAKIRYVQCTSFALLHLGLGEYDQALTHLEAGCEQRALAMTNVRSHPVYDPLRSEPRFTALLQRVGLA